MNLAAPAEIRNAPEPQPAPINVVATPVAKGIWRLKPGGTTVFEFADHLTLFELNGGARQAQAVIAYARTLAPVKPVTQMIASHNHFDHVTGLRRGLQKA